MNKKYFQIREKKLRSLLDRCAKQPRVLNTSRSRKIIIKEMKRNKKIFRILMKLRTLILFLVHRIIIRIIKTKYLKTLRNKNKGLNDNREINININRIENIVQNEIVVVFSSENPPFYPVFNSAL